MDSLDHTLLAAQVALLQAAVTAVFEAHPSKEKLRAIFEQRCADLFDMMLRTPASEEAIVHARNMAETMLRSLE